MHSESRDKFNRFLYFLEVSIYDGFKFIVALLVLSKPVKGYSTVIQVLVVGSVR